jgi:aldehyde:ferredoxin oxidoreductase
MNERFGYSGQILWLDLAQKRFDVEARDEIFWRRHVGGGLVATALLLEKTEPGNDPLSGDNLLIFASSVVAGHRGAGLARFTTAAKSPMTGGIGETRTEGPWGVALKASGADVLVFKGRAERPTTVVIENGSVTFLDATELWGSQVGAVVDELEQQLGEDIHVATIGPAGENMVRFASIVTDRTYQASRMGTGAVMGAKNLKAVVLRPGKRPPVYDPSLMEQLTVDFDEGIQENDLSRWQYEPPGFSCWIYLHGLDAALCVNNYSASTFEGIDAFKEEQFLARSIEVCGCPGCPNDCIKAIHPNGANDLDPRASGIHQEITGTMGPNIGVGRLDDVLQANNLCNQYGLDPTSLGFTISLAMELFERGILFPEDNDGRELRFGDAAGALAMVEQIALRQGLGDLLAEGSNRAAERMGGKASQYAMQVKGLEMVPFEPRSQTNLALGYAVAPIGPRYDICEHDWDFDTVVGWEHTMNLSRTLGILERIPMAYVGPDKVRNFKALFNLWSAADALDLCIFAVAPTRLLSLPAMAQMVYAATGWETSSYEIMRIGERRNHLMRWYNCREGLSADDDGLPDRFFEEPIAAGPRKGDVIDRESFQQAICTLYAMMGWDEEGQPTTATLYDAGLERVLAGIEE